MPPVLGLGLGVGFGGRRASVAFVTASGQVMHSGFAQAVGGLANGATSVKLYWGSPNGVLAGTATVVAGAWSTTVTPAAAQVGTTTLVALAGGAIAALSIVVRATPRDLGAAGWWVANDGNLADSGFPVPFGAVTLDEASVADFNTWSAVNAVRSDSIDDPVGGTAAFRVTDTVDGVPTAHRLAGTPSAYAATWYDFTFWVRCVVGSQWCRVYTAGGGQSVYLNGYLGTSTGASGCTVEWGATSGSWRQVNVKVRGVGVSGVWVMSADDTPNSTYTGTGSRYVDVYSPTFTQPRCSVLADESGNAADLAQATDAQQPLCYTGFKAVNGIAVLYQEDGRASYLDTTSAAVVAVASGDDPAFAICGVWGSGLASFTAPARFHGAGSIVDLPFYLYSGNIYSQRHDGTTPSAVLIESGGATRFSSPVVYTCLINSDRSVDLWVGGVHVGSVNRANLVSATMTSMRGGYAGTASIETQAELALFPGAHTYAELAGVEAAMRARWGL